MLAEESRAKRGRSGMAVNTRLIGGLVTLTLLAVGAGGVGWYSVRTIDGELNEITGAIAASVEEQTATTSEISRSPTEAARGTDAVPGNLGSVKEAAGHTAQASGSVSQAANDLAQQAEGLKSAVQTFLSEVRAA